MSVSTDPQKRRVSRAVENLADDLVDLSNRIRDTPELGFAEVETARTVTDWLERRGMNCTYVAGTAVVADVSASAPGPSVALLGELDAVHVPTHPDANARTGAAHACGHHASLAAACGAVVAVAEVLPELAGRLVFVGTPAEEIVPDLPTSDRSDGALPTGKAELIRRGVFDEIDLALMVHTGREDGPRFSVGDTLNGAVRITADFHGTAAHSGSTPWLGVDATRAARFAMDAVDAQQDQFVPHDHVRI
ncbi:MAG: M20/M25/M40 family metallo-hydrolase, partial [Actinomycetia bacterium]|nr:M20/M25/M40 family metallo-hydrolase [Actinomycetes bacterium]